MRTWRIQPAISLRETYSDNISLQRNVSKEADWVTELTPKVSITANTARLKGNLDYALTGIAYARNSEANDHQHALNAIGQFEAIENFFFVEARGVISQRIISIFDARPTSNTSDTPNRTETRTFSITPYIQGFIGRSTSYDVRYDVARTRTDEGEVSDGDVRTLTAKLENNSDLSRFGWSADFKDRRYELEGGDSQERLARGSLSYRPDRSLRMFVRAGRESNNFFGGDRSKTIHGAGVEWNPSERTQLSAENDQRFFGRGYRYAFRHRTVLSAWSLVMSKDTNNTIDMLRAGSQITPFQRLFELLSTEVPDPILRAERARQTLIASGISPDASAESAFLANEIFVDKRVEASVALLGARNTLTLSAFRSERKPVAGLGATGDDFAVASLIKENGAAINLGSKLSPLTTLTTSVAWNRVTGTEDSTASSETRQLGYYIQLSRSLGPKTAGALGYRHVRFDSNAETTSDYRENAVFASIEHRF